MEKPKTKVVLSPEVVYDQDFEFVMQWLPLNLGFPPEIGVVIGRVRNWYKPYLVITFIKLRIIIGWPFE